MRYILIALVVFCAGCEQRDRSLENYQKHALPKNAQVVEDLGNGWVIYKMNILGETRWFKVRCVTYTIQAVTELNPPKIENHTY